MLSDYDVDGDGTVTVRELAAGAELLRKQTQKVRARLRCLPSARAALSYSLCRTRTRRR